MIKRIVFSLLLIVFCGSAFSQRWYRTWRWEFIFQSATPENNGQQTAVRFSGFFNYSHFTHFNPTRFWGLYWGGGIRNTGFSLYYDKTFVKETRRVYTLGIPLAIKFGNMTKLKYIFAGGELEFPFHYKQKKYQEDVKVSVYSEWMSNRTERILPSVFVGYQAGENLQFYVRYYCTPFLNYSYEGVDFGDPVSYSNIDRYKMINFAICLTGIDRLTSKQKKEHRKLQDEIITGL